LEILFSQITENIATRAGEEGFIKTSSDHGNSGKIKGKTP
jgi:hypothetical protein